MDRGLLREISGENSVENDVISVMRVIGIRWGGVIVGKGEGSFEM